MRAEENERLTRIGPGTPCGEMLRRYWWPIACAEEVKSSPVPVRLLGEDLVLFRTGDGYGLLERYCAHRRASLEFGRVEERGIRCCYHGWLYSPQGQCLEQPQEPTELHAQGQDHAPRLSHPRGRRRDLRLSRSRSGAGVPALRQSRARRTATACCRDASRM